MRTLSGPEEEVRTLTARKPAPLRTTDAWRFVEALADLPSACWRNIRVREFAGRAEAIIALNTLVRQRRVALLAWRFNDGIDTVRWLRRGSGDEPVFDAARLAALAILLRGDLGERRFRALYEPFEAGMLLASSASSLRNLCARDATAPPTFERRLALRT